MSVQRKNICCTDGIEVMADPRFSEEYSNLLENKYIFEYDIHITNHSPHSIKLLSRKWEITDGFGIKRIIEGEGVIGQQPELAHGEQFSYSSWCPLPSALGRMRGVYVMMRETDGLVFDVKIPDFVLMANFLNN